MKNRKTENPEKLKNRKSEKHEKTNRTDKKTEKKIIVLHTSYI